MIGNFGVRRQKEGGSKELVMVPGLHLLREEGMQVGGREAGKWGCMMAPQATTLEMWLGTWS